MGLFASPNRAAVMNALPANRRGVGGGMSTTFQNASMVLSIGIFFSLMIVGPRGLAARHDADGAHGARRTGGAGARDRRRCPPVAVLFASLLGYNPVQSLLGSHTLAQLHPADARYLTGHSFFPSLISGPFHDGLIVAFVFAIAACLIAAAASWFMGEKFVHADDQHEVGAEPAETPLDFAQPEAGAPDPQVDTPGDEAGRPHQVARS